MPQQSKYSDQQFEALMARIIEVLEHEKTDRDLSLMVLGNVITRTATSGEADRQGMAERFAQVLVKAFHNAQLNWC